MKTTLKRHGLIAGNGGKVKICVCDFQKAGTNRLSGYMLLIILVSEKRMKLKNIEPTITCDNAHMAFLVFYALKSPYLCGFVQERHVAFL